MPVRARNGMVASQNAIASQVGMEVLLAGGNAVDAAVATAFALAVVHPEAGNIGGGGFLLLRPSSGPASVYDFREQAPAAATPTMFLTDGRYDRERHHQGHLAVGVPGTVAGLHLAWLDNGRLPWKDLLQPAIALARDGFMVSDGLARALRAELPRMKPYPASLAQFSRAGVPYEMGDLLQQEDLAKTLERIAAKGARGFYEGETALLIEKEMKARGGLITREDLKSYTVYRRPPLRGTYRGHELLTAPPPSSGGTGLLQSLNVLEGYDLKAMGFGSSRYLHHVAEALRRAFADRARFLGDPSFVKDMPVERLISKEYAASLRKTIALNRASVSSPASFEWPAESNETTHFSVVDGEGSAVSLTYTLEDGYGSAIVVPGAGFLLNNEMGDFNAGPGLTDATGLVGSEPNLAAPGKRMLSNMTPTIVVEGRAARARDRGGRRTQDPRHGASDRARGSRLRDERAGGDRCAAHQSPVAAGRDPARAVRALGRHRRRAQGERPPGRGARGGRMEPRPRDSLPRRHARRRQRSPQARRCGNRALTSTCRAEENEDVGARHPEGDRP